MGRRCKWDAASCLAPYTPCTQDLEPFYRALLARVPTGMQLVVDDIGGDGSASVGVTWHLELEGVAVPYGRGLSFYRIDSRQQIAYLRESPEHVAKVPLSSLPIISLAAPLLKALGPLAPGVFARCVESYLICLRFINRYCVHLLWTPILFASR